MLSVYSQLSFVLYKQALLSTILFMSYFIILVTISIYTHTAVSYFFFFFLLLQLLGENSCADRVQGVFLNFRTNMNRPFLKTPFYPYVRPVENQQLHFATLVKYSGGRQNRAVSYTHLTLPTKRIV